MQLIATEFKQTIRYPRVLIKKKDAFQVQKN